MFFSPKENLVLPDAPKNMGDGWETKRKRGVGAIPGKFLADWVIVKLGCRGVIKKIEVDTAFFKGNFPDKVSEDVIAEKWCKKFNPLIWAIQLRQMNGTIVGSVGCQ